jgi:hypothetical protein
MWRRPSVTTLILLIPVILTLPLQAQQKLVAPNFSSACAELKFSVTTPDVSPAEPFTQEQVVSVVRDGFGDESGAKLIGQRGIDFAPSEDFYQTLKAAGASEAFLKALRAAVAPGFSPAGNVAPTLRACPELAEGSACAELKLSATTSPVTLYGSHSCNRAKVLKVMELLGGRGYHAHP